MGIKIKKWSKLGKWGWSYFKEKKFPTNNKCSICGSEVYWFEQLVSKMLKTHFDIKGALIPINCPLCEEIFGKNKAQTGVFEINFSLDKDIYFDITKIHWKKNKEKTSKS